ncbi:hypothetical protein GCM10009839_32380 [Catenulispora yoronensis]|uniref:DUF3562 domain-containing protein n=1 Tax=Catenulispora yoronensis TaxID=450799 RepID=A0ABP5FRM1_9ACTN
MTASGPQDRETGAIEQVLNRLQTKFADRTRTDVADVVHKTADGFAGARIRDYIPLLVERIARDELAHRFAA